MDKIHGINDIVPKKVDRSFFPSYKQQGQEHAGNNVEKEQKKETETDRSYYDKHRGKRKLPHNQEYFQKDNTPVWIKKVYHAANSQQLNKPEFVYLVAFYLDFIEFKTKISEHELTTEDRQYIKDTLNQFKQTYEKFINENLTPALDNKLKTYEHPLSEIYDGIISGNINLDETAFLIEDLIDYSKTRGRFRQDNSQGGMRITPEEASHLNRKLDEVENYIEIMNHENFEW